MLNDISKFGECTNRYRYEYNTKQNIIYKKYNMKDFSTKNITHLWNIKVYKRSRYLKNDGSKQPVSFTA